VRAARASGVHVPAGGAALQEGAEALRGEDVRRAGVGQLGELAHGLQVRAAVQGLGEQAAPSHSVSVESLQPVTAPVNCRNAGSAQQLHHRRARELADALHRGVASRASTRGDARHRGATV